MDKFLFKYNLIQKRNNFNKFSFKNISAKKKTQIKSEKIKNKKELEEEIISNKDTTPEILTTPTKGKEEKIFLYSHDTARKYYRMNVLPLLGYLTISGMTITNPEYPDYLKNTMLFFMAVCSATLAGIAIYSRRHINSMYLMKPSNFLIVNTFSKLGFGKDKLYQIPLKEVNELVPISKYIGTSKTGVYLVKLNQNTKYYKILNFFFIRPTSNVYFDQIFKSKVRK